MVEYQDPDAPDAQRPGHRLVDNVGTLGWLWIVFVTLGGLVALLYGHVLTLHQAAAMAIVIFLAGEAVVRESSDIVGRRGRVLSALAIAARCRCLLSLLTAADDRRCPHPAHRR